MSKQRNDLSDDSFKKSLFTSLIIIWISITVICVMRTKDEMEADQKASIMHFKQLDITPEQIIDIDKIGKEEKLTVKLQKRNLQFGLEEVAPFILTSNEWMKMGKTIIPMRDIIKNENTDLSFKADKKSPHLANNPHHAVFILKKSANIWDLHHHFFKNVLLNNGIHVSPIADDPDGLGFSSGKGKIVNFSEKMAYIHDIDSKETRQAPRRLVVYPLKRLFALVNQLKHSKISRLEFDGHSMWLPDHKITLAGIF